MFMGHVAGRPAVENDDFHLCSSDLVEAILGGPLRYWNWMSNSNSNPLVEYGPKFPPYYESPSTVWYKIPNSVMVVPVFSMLCPLRTYHFFIISSGQA